MARRKLGVGGPLGMALALAPACTTGNGLGSERGPVCPSCTAWVGGETGDFESDFDECATWFLESAEVTDEQARELGVDPDTLRARVDVHFTEGFRWELATDPEVANPPPRGYSEETTISVTMRMVGTLRHQELDPQLCSEGVCKDPERDSLSYECPPAGYDGLTFEVQVDLELGDGAVSVDNATAAT